MLCWLVYQSPDKELSTTVSGEYFWVKLLEHVYKREHIFTLQKRKRRKKNLQMQIFFSYLSKVSANFTQMQWKNLPAITLRFQLPLKNSQPLNLHFAVAEIFTLKSITLCVWHILEHRKSIYLEVMRNSGINLAKELLQSPPLFILSALYTCTTSPRPKAHTKKKTPPKNPAIFWWKKFHWFCMWLNLTWYDPALDNLRRKVK